MRVQLPPTPTLAVVARDVMRAIFNAPPEKRPAEWRVDRETYSRIVAEMVAFRAALGKPVTEEEIANGLAVCRVPLFPESK